MLIGTIGFGPIEFINLIALVAVILSVAALVTYAARIFK